MYPGPFQVIEYTEVSGLQQYHTAVGRHTDNQHPGVVQVPIAASSDLARMLLLLANLDPAATHVLAVCSVGPGTSSVRDHGELFCKIQHAAVEALEGSSQGPQKAVAIEAQQLAAFKTIMQPTLLVSIPAGCHSLQQLTADSIEALVIPSGSSSFAAADKKAFMASGAAAYNRLAALYHGKQGAVVEQAPGRHCGWWCSGHNCK